MKPVLFVLQKRWFAEFAAGRKTIEWRRHKGRFAQRHLSIGRRCVLQCGYRPNVARKSRPAANAPLRAHAAHLDSRFAEAGVRTAYVDCYTERSEREIIFDRFRRGLIGVICNVATLTTGIDLDVRCVIDARPTKSEIRFVQTLGRGLRPAPGKDYCLFLDHAGNHHRFGLITEIGEDRDVLDIGDRRPRRGQRGKESTESKVRACKSCHFVLGRSDAKCPICGTAAERISSIIEKDGELVELGSRAVARPSNGSAAQIEFISQLRGYAVKHRYKHGRVSH